MFKTFVATAALALVSAQNLASIAEQAQAAAAPVLGQPLPIVETANALSLTINNYEWTLTEQGNNYELSVEQLANNANNLAPTLAALLANVGAVAQDNENAEAASNLLDAEAASVGVALENNNLPEAANAYGAQLAANNGEVAAAAESGYNQLASALATNQNGLLDTVNQELAAGAPEQYSLSEGVEAAVANAGQLNGLAASQAGNLPVQVDASPEQLTNLAASQAGNLDTAEAANSLGDLANQALNAGTEAANNNLPSNVAQTVSNAAENASATANNGIEAAASQLNAENVENAQDAANLVNGNQ